MRTNAFLIDSSRSFEKNMKISFKWVIKDPSTTFCLDMLESQSFFWKYLWVQKVMKNRKGVISHFYVEKWIFENWSGDVNRDLIHLLLETGNDWHIIWKICFQGLDRIFCLPEKNELCLNLVAFKTEVRQIRGSLELDPVHTVWGASKASSSGRQSRLRWGRMLSWLTLPEVLRRTWKYHSNEL